MPVVIGGNVVIAYEPMWTWLPEGAVQIPEQVQKTHFKIRDWLSKNVSDEVAAKTRILYGGPVDKDNCETLLAQPDIDGFLMNCKTLRPNFTDIVEIVNSSL